MNFVQLCQDTMPLMDKKNHSELSRALRGLGIARLETWNEAMKDKYKKMHYNAAARAGHPTKETKRFINPIWCTFMGFNYEIGDESEALTVTQMMRDQAASFSALWRNCPAWMRCLPTLTVVVLQIVVGHIGIHFYIATGKDEMAATEHIHTGLEEKWTGERISSAVQGIIRSLSEIRKDYVIEWSNDTAEKIPKKIQYRIHLAEKLALGFNDVVPIVTAFSKLWSSQIMEGWKRESVVEDGENG